MKYSKRDYLGCRQNRWSKKAIQKSSWIRIFQGLSMKISFIRWFLLLHIVSQEQPLIVPISERLTTPIQILDTLFYPWIAPRSNLFSLFSIIFLQILKLLKGEDEIEKWVKKVEEDEDCFDDEVYPNLNTELHFSLAMLDVEDNDSVSVSSLERSNNSLFSSSSSSMELQP